MLKTIASLAIALALAIVLYVIMTHVSTEIGEVLRAATQSR